tara:strand:+ start:251 stop:712 length:462 start_codon:yes stop_codon:yes gene_type:complete
MVVPNVVDKATETVGILLSSIRVDISRTVNKITAAKAKSEYELKPVTPGRMIIITPANPIKIALHLRQPTCSPKKIAAAIVIAKGNDCNIAVTFASGMYFSAVRKVTVVPISATIRTIRRRLFFVEYFCRNDLVINAKIISGGKLIRPRKKIA